MATIGAGSIFASRSVCMLRLVTSETVKRHIREARVIFAMAVDDDRLLENPFDKLAGGQG